VPTFVAVFACSFSVVESLFWIFLVDVPVALGSSFALDGAVGQLEQRVPSPARRWARPPLPLPSVYCPAQPLLFVSAASS